MNKDWFQKFAVGCSDWEEGFIEEKPKLISLIFNIFFFLSLICFITMFVTSFEKNFLVWFNIFGMISISILLFVTKLRDQFGFVKIAALTIPIIIVAIFQSILFYSHSIVAIVIGCFISFALLVVICFKVISLYGWHLETR